MNIKNISKIFSSDFWSDDSVRKPQKATIVVEKEKNYVMLSTSQIFRIWLINKFSKKEGKSFNDMLATIERQNHDEHRTPHSEHDNATPETVPVYFIAILLDGVVVDVLRASQKVADYLLSNPQFELFSPSVNPVTIGSRMVDGEWVD